jgi:predicted PurR-regulated permease PerM
MRFLRFGKGRFGERRIDEKVVLTGADRAKAIEEAIPVPVEIAGQWAWRILAVVGVLVVFGLLIIQLREIVIPFMVALLLSALLVPLVNFLIRHKWPRGLAVAVAMVGTIGVITGLITLIYQQVRAGFPELQDRSIAAYDDLRDYLAVSPLGISPKEFDAFVTDTIANFREDGGALWTGALSVGTTAGHVLVGALLALFATLFILLDGKHIWAWVTRLFPRQARKAVGDSGRAGWLTLTTFVKVQIFVAAVDAFGIGIGAFILGLIFGGGDGFPLVIPIAIAVFLGSFIPVVGAVVSGALAVFVALVFLGPVPGLIMVGIVLLVQQIEGHVLQPLVMGSAVKVHPIAVVFAVAAGGGIAGIPGALFAVPVVAVVNVMVNYIASGRWRTKPRPETKDVVSPA